MNIEFLLKDFKKLNKKASIIWGNKSYSYSWLLKRIEFYSNYFSTDQFKESKVIALEGDFTPESISIFLALIKHNFIIVPQINSNKKKQSEKYNIAQVELIISVDNKEKIELKKITKNQNIIF